ncbi:MAG: MFS transporter [Methanolinea sp.]|nr:MFS transporter [Methanolinea sp.]
MRFREMPVALRVILLLGVVSLCGDIVYEGARSVSGPFLLALGASAFTVAWVAGLGEFIGYAVRLASGYLADRTGRYWTLATAGYLMVGAIPLLVFAGSWQVAVVLLLAERLGKAIRSPAKDAILSHAAHRVGRGWGFGIHEAMDQVGAVAGPLAFSASIALYGGYGEGFALMAVPFVLLVAALALARRSVTDPASLEAPAAAAVAGDERFPRVMLPYGVFTALTMAGFLVFPLVAFHLGATGTVPEVQIPVFYAVAMATDALCGLLLGRLYDRAGLPVLVLVPLVNIPIAPLAFSGGYWGALAAAVLWGISMGGQETVLRAALADLTSVRKRGFAYGVFNTIYGGAWFAGSVACGALYDAALSLLFSYCTAMQAAALGAFVWLKRTAGAREPAGE